MEFSTVEVRPIAEELAGKLVAELAAGETHIADVERGLRELLRQLGCELLRALLERQGMGEGPTVPCPCGGTLTYQRRRAATVYSVFGPVRYKRAYYAGCVCGQGYAPLDERLGLQPGQVTAGLSELVALAGVELAFDHSRKWLREFLLFEVAGNTVRKETQRFGQMQSALEAEQKEHSQDVAYLQERRRTVTDPPRRRYGSLDAAKVRIEADEKLPEIAVSPEKWRDIKVGCWYDVEPVPPSQHGARQRHKERRGDQALRATNISYYTEITASATFGDLLWATGCEREADLAQELVFVADGAPWIWNQVQLRYPGATQIVDWYHAADCLKRVAQDAFSDIPQREIWLDALLDALWDGDLRHVIRRCAALSTCEAARKAVTYFENNRHRMDYARFRQQGYFIGSGTVESACKQIVTQRLKCSGARWSVDGANATAKARAAWLGGGWQRLCEYRRLPLAV